MYHYKKENAYGDYVKDGTRFAVTEASVVVCPGKRTPEQCGWVQYPDLQTAVEAWGLEEWAKYKAADGCKVD